MMIDDKRASERATERATGQTKLLTTPRKQGCCNEAPAHGDDTTVEWNGRLLLS